MARKFRIRRELQVDGAITINSSNETLGGQTVKVLIKDQDGMAVLATGLVVPADSGAGFAKGCLFIDTNVAAGTTGLYVNVGTTAACNFDAVSDA